MDNPRTFYLTISAVVKLDQRVFDQVDDSFRASYYNLRTDADVADHVGYNLVRGASLSALDGFADLPDALAEVVDVEVENVTEDG